MLIIMDGWGIAKNGEENRSAIITANTPFYDRILQQYPHSKLEASGLAVGLPDGQMGNHRSFRPTAKVASTGSC